MSDESRSGEFKLPPELSDLEHSLRELPLPSKSLDTVLDRDELMFQSGWAAALADRNDVLAVTSAPAVRWVWPALAGTFATLSAALAIALFSTPTGYEGPAVAQKPAVGMPSLVADPQQPESRKPDFDRQANPVDVRSDQNPIASAFPPFVERVFRFQPDPSSALAMRMRLLRTMELNEVVRSVSYRTSTRTQAAPLKANSHRKKQLWEQL